ncbi:hypothetical protein AJ79_03210 [Helicocarpus griseus UAMH5409]|uniref:Uncharacterized protein n=1 Tax=Helicocarpus griseus UAMH5409 TaxID=1447875 RepID=A0A2B7XZ68_9EURO|nr:hypothetical protein AJ79_03210 [Helicocarpus griseus UAMH5409]
MTLKTTELDKMSIHKLVKCFGKVTFTAMQKSDVEIMEKNHISGPILVAFGTHKDLEKMGLSWGAQRGTADEAGLFSSEPFGSQPETKRVHVQDSSGNLSDTQNKDKSVKKKQDHIDLQLRFAK